MRPEVLNSLFTPALNLVGVGAKIELNLRNLLKVSRVTGTNILDLLMHFPTSVIDRSFRCEIENAPIGEIVTLEIIVGKHKPQSVRRLKAPYRIEVYDNNGDLFYLVFFHNNRDFLRKILVEGEKRYVSGKLEVFGETIQMVHPDYIVTAEEFADLPEFEPVYPLSAGITAKTLRKIINNACKLCPDLPEWLDKNWLQSKNWQDFKTALLSCHNPKKINDLNIEDINKSRIAYDELLANQLAITMTRTQLKRKAGIIIKGSGFLRKKILNALPFSLTNSQQQALQEIYNDMAETTRMLRLLQGDVGSGKTVVALMTLVTAVEAGYQGALMAPTEILARQHYNSILEYCRETDIKIAVLTGRDKGKKRHELLEKLKNGDIDILIGTHAIFQEDIKFVNLALVIIDEQHRFGVHQRLALHRKGTKVDVLVMTATPIPRTLTLTIYGDMEVSKLREKPEGRKPINTRVMPSSKINELIEALERAVQKGARCYWVCPLIEETEKISLSAAEDRYQDLNKIFPNKVGLIHGRMNGEQKDEIMGRFQTGEVTILVATTVIEVGVNVPEASIMVIEHAERFGLAQLHQLRGRVGRGNEVSSCILLYKETLTDTATERLKTMRETEDGFIIAEQDLKLRGAGEALGTRQSGIPIFKVADLQEHKDLLKVARDDANLMLQKDPKLESERGKALRILLYLFERDTAIKLLSAG